jgi:hypothetical protein
MAIIDETTETETIETEITETEITETETTETTPAKGKRKPPVTQKADSPEVQAALAALAEAKAKAIEEAKAKKEAEAKAKEHQKELEKKAKEHQKELEKKAKAEERAKAKEIAKAAIPVLPEVSLAGLAPRVEKTLTEGKVSVALKEAFNAEANSELGYKTLAERFGYSVIPLVQALVEERVWPTQTEGKNSGAPWSYKKLYDREKELGIKSYGHMVNRASERFTMLNPENIAKRQQALEEAKARAKEEAAKKATEVANSSKAKGATVQKTVGEIEVANLEYEQLLDLAKACILALDQDGCDLLALDPDIRQALRLDD